MLQWIAYHYTPNHMSLCSDYIFMFLNLTIGVLSRRSKAFRGPMVRLSLAAPASLTSTRQPATYHKTIICSFQIDIMWVLLHQIDFSPWHNIILIVYRYDLTLWHSLFCSGHQLNVHNVYVFLCHLFASSHSSLWHTFFSTECPRKNFTPLAKKSQKITVWR